MSEEKSVYNIKAEPIKRNRETMLAAQRLKQFCVQFDKMTEVEKKDCISRIDKLAPGLLVEFYNALNEYLEPR